MEHKLNQIEEMLAMLIQMVGALNSRVEEIAHNLTEIKGTLQYKKEANTNKNTDAVRWSDMSAKDRKESMDALKD